MANQKQIIKTGIFYDNPPDARLLNCILIKGWQYLGCNKTTILYQTPD